VKGDAKQGCFELKRKIKCEKILVIWKLDGRINDKSVKSMLISMIVVLCDTHILKLACRCDSMT